MLIARVPSLLKRTLRGVTWEMPASETSGGEKEVYLTFDDGPTPEVTEWVLEELNKYNARATFFCLGKNVEQHPGICEQILAGGHSIGNHSYSHIKGFRSSVKAYRENVELASRFIQSSLFRPPYGRILPKHVRDLSRDYRIIMWSVLSVDYNASLEGDQVVRNVLDHVRPGSIIVFHDSVKASKNLYYALPRVLEYLSAEGFQMKAISES